MALGAATDAPGVATVALPGPTPPSPGRMMADRCSGVVIHVSPSARRLSDHVSGFHARGHMQASVLASKPSFVRVHGG